MSTPQTANPFLLVKEIQDVYIRKNFQNLSDFFGNQNQLLNFQFKELVFTKEQSNVLVAHGLGFIPQDIILSKITGPGTVSFNHGLFDSTNMNLSVSDACRVRFFYGTYWNFSSGAQNQPTDLTSYSAIPSQSTVAGATSQQAAGAVTIVNLPQTTPGNNPSLYTASTGNVALLIDATKTSFTVQLPLGSGILGQTIIVEKTDLSFNPVTIRAALSSSDTLDGSPLLFLTTSLERVVLLATSTGYRVLSRDYFKGWNTMNPALGSTFNSPPTFGSIVTQTERWRREGPDCILEYNLEWNAAGTAGNGDYWFLLPEGLVADASVIPTDATEFLGVVGSMLLDVNGVVTTGVMLLIPGNVLIARDNGGWWGSGYKDASTGAGSISFTARVPIQGWGG